MIDVYFFHTPNGFKIPIFLEEAGLPYVIKPINIVKGEQMRPEFLRISPNNRIPAIVDHDTGMSIFESGAILRYLADKTGRFGGADLQERTRVDEWLYWQVDGLGPMMGQLGHFVKFAKEKVPYAIKRYSDEATRLSGVMERRLEQATYLAGDAYTIADMAAYAWSTYFEVYGIAVGPQLKRWQTLVGERPAVIKALTLKVADA